MRLRNILFIALSGIAVIPVVTLAAWVYIRAEDKEVDSVKDTHLLLARNLGGALDRYAKDARAGFELAASLALTGSASDDIGNLMTHLEFNHLCVADWKTRRVVTSIVPNSFPCPEFVPEKRFETFKGLAVKDKTVFTPVLKGPTGQPTLYLLRRYEDYLAIGAISTRYIVNRGESIAFGKKGHAAIIDPTGTLMAHPTAEWHETMKNIAKLDPAKRMMARETGISLFFSPALKADMIAGFTSVPTTGWGVMIPQPYSELKEDAAMVRTWAIGIAGGGIIAAGILAWFLSGFLTRSLSSVATASRMMTEGDLDARAEGARSFEPKEFTDLASAFNTMAEGISQSNYELSQALVRAEEGASAKTAFLTMISHEIRTPMNGVVGVSEMLLETGLDTQQREMADIIHDSANSLLGIVNDVLDMSKIEAGHLEVEFEPVSPKEVLENVINEMMPAAAAKNLALLKEFGPDIPNFLMTDGLRIRQVLINLINNAIKFTERGRVRVKLSRSREHDGQDCLAISVEDTGIGINRDTIDRLFTPFSQADATTTRRYGGTGLGLSISKRLANLLGGDISVSSVEGEGSTFRFIHPIDGQRRAISGKEAEHMARAAVGSNSVDSVVEDDVGDKPRILVAEDHPTNRWLIRKQLEQLGYAPDIHDDGRTALAAYKERKYDLLITDYLMPEFDGIDLTRAIRRLEAVSGTRLPIIGLTANAFEDTLEKCAEVGMDDVLTKPVGKSTLGNMLRRYLEGDLLAFNSSEHRAQSDPANENAAAQETFSATYCEELFEGQPAEGIAWLQDYLETMSAQLREIELHRRLSDFENLGKNLHRLAGASLAAGASELGQACKQLHQVVLECEDGSELDPQLAELERIAGKARSAIASYVDKLAESA